MDFILMHAVALLKQNLATYIAQIYQLASQLTFIMSNVLLLVFAKHVCWLSARNCSSFRLECLVKHLTAAVLSTPSQTVNIKVGPVAAKSLVTNVTACLCLGSVTVSTMSVHSLDADGKLPAIFLSDQEGSVRSGLQKVLSCRTVHVSGKPVARTKTSLKHTQAIVFVVL